MMESQASSDPKRAIIEELLRGREFTNQLLQLVRHGSDSNIRDEESLLITGTFAEDLVKNILRSFTNTLLLFNTNICDSHDVSITNSSSAWGICGKPEEHQNLDEGCEILNTRNRRGCYKRKRTIETGEKDSPILVEDGHAWRKYGQKMTRSSKYLRNYYRCSHKYDQGCPAMKQVQRIQEKPPLYRTTYYGLHTCNNHMMTLDPSSPSESDHSSMLLSFNNNTIILPAKEGQHPFHSSSSTMKKHEDENDLHDLHIHMEQNQSSLSHDYLLSSQNDQDVSVLSSTLDLFSSVKVESFEMDDVILRCFDFDEFVRFGL